MLGLDDRIIPAADVFWLGTSAMEGVKSGMPLTLQATASASMTMLFVGRCVRA
jgi:hypothetical protein